MERETSTEMERFFSALATPRSVVSAAAERSCITSPEKGRINLPTRKIVL